MSAQTSASDSAYVYMVECADGTLYTGWTTNVERRLQAHNSGRGGRYTRLRGPVRLVYIEPQPDRAAAMKREAVIKRWPRSRKLSLVDSVGIKAGSLNATGTSPD